MSRTFIRGLVAVGAVHGDPPPEAIRDRQPARRGRPGPNSARFAQINPATGAVRAGVPAVTPFSLEGGFSMPRPTIALGPERRVYLSDPTAGRVVEVATNPLRVTRTIPVGGTPAGMAVLGTK